MKMIKNPLGIALLSMVLFLFVPLLFAETTKEEEILRLLSEGNSRYAAQKPAYPHLTQSRRIQTATEGQKPSATVLSCSDSRVPAEYIFDAGIGDIFVVRVAGNVADTDEIGTIEYGVEHLKTPLLIVMGHSKCGAVTAVARGDKVGGSIPSLVDNIIPAVSRAKKKLGRELTDALISESIEQNVWQSLEDTIKKSAIVRELMEKGEVQAVGAIYNIEDGTVRWLGPHPAQEDLMKKAAREETRQAAEKKEEPLSTPVPLVKTQEAETEGASPVPYLNIAILFLGMTLLFILVYALLIKQNNLLKTRIRTKILSGIIILILSTAGSFLILDAMFRGAGAGAGGLFYYVLAGLLCLVVGIIYGLVIVRSLMKYIDRLKTAD